MHNMGIMDQGLSMKLCKTIIQNLKQYILLSAKNNQLGIAKN